jgi:hypothetical protein
LLSRRLIGAAVDLLLICCCRHSLTAHPSSSGTCVLASGFDASDVTDAFPKYVEGLRDALPPALVDLDEGDFLKMRIGPSKTAG